jgi:hypothetical protein
LQRESLKKGEERRKEGRPTNYIKWSLQEQDRAILLKMCLKKPSGGKNWRKKRKGRKGKRSVQRNVCFASYNRKM